MNECKETRKELQQVVSKAVRKELGNEPVPYQEWWKLKECCKRKGIHYKTVCNKTYLQPNGGKADAVVGGRKVWHKDTVEAWVKMSDTDMLRSHKPA